MKRGKKAKGVVWGDVCRIAAALPGATEATSYGTPAFFVRQKLFVRLHQSRESVVINIQIAEREKLIKTDPETFFITDHYRQHPYVLVRLSTATEDVLRAMITESWRRVAPANLAREYGQVKGSGAKVIAAKSAARRPSEKYLERVRRIGGMFPETLEKLSHGAPTFFAGGKKVFVMFSDNHHNDGHVAVWLPAPTGMQAVLIEHAPEKFYRPPYVGVSGWIGVDLDHVGDDELTALIRQAWRIVAPKKLLAAFDQAK